MSEAIGSKRCTLVVGIDLSDEDNAALDCAITCATSCEGAEVHVVHVARRATVDASVSLPLNVIPLDGDEWEEHRRLVLELEGRCESRRRRLAALRVPLPSGRLRTHLRRGDPASQIIDLAQRLDASLVVVGTNHGRSWRRLLRGSVAEQVVRFSPCGVLVVANGRQLPEVPRAASASA